MSRSTHSDGLDIGHPAPQRHDARPVLLVFALLAAPAAWTAQLLFAFASTSYICAGPTATAVPAWLAPAVIGLNLAALAIAASALVVALALLRRTLDEHRQRSGGVLEVGEGRTRFLAVWGLFTSLAFVVATLANSFSLLLVPLCKT
ncbi:hypothetical protein [Mesorhizobium sp. ES1-3]|uniref:hypothetical protein n=1 Tax=Mesorhizobium sp. ES1-3 TaxID=2876628 RepID=UPI001CCC769D|nr:hypothetical protein [Mesorhizobium sp. ES1-3]MBZ9673667.1 hypothetical protein [Mesorhizobium sp. ES1-3]